MGAVMNNCKKWMLVVEDDEEMRSLLKDFIVAEGFETDSAINGSEAFLKVAKESFDLIIADVRMPELTGLDIRHLRERPLPI
jgi:DNA-binding response OmpR family regulator